MFKTNRRSFLQTSAAVTAGTLVAKPFFKRSLEKLRTVHVGVGGMGASDLKSIASHAMVEVAAICDVDSNVLTKTGSEHPGARKFADYREMLTEIEDSIDAVVISTPDHSHAPAALTAMKMGKPVYCQKPLTHQVHEARQLREVAEANQLVTQMGIQVHSHAIYRRGVAMIQAGVIGLVRQVHAWSNKNWGFDGASLPASATVPEHLNWDLWIGTAESREFVPRVYHPGQWRKLIDFGTGTLGDMGVHIFDSPYAALKLTAPNWAKTACRAPTGVGHPEKNVVEYEFPGTEFTTDTLRWTWYDGAYAPPKPENIGLDKSHSLPGQGSLFVGEEGVMLLPHVGEAKLFPENKFKDYKRPELESRNHYHEWVDACLGDGTTSTPFRYGGPLTEALLLGVVANRFPQQSLQWNAAELKVTNLEEANQLIRREYRAGFELPELSGVGG